MGLADGFRSGWTLAVWGRLELLREMEDAEEDEEGDGDATAAPGTANGPGDGSEAGHEDAGGPGG